MYIYMYVIDKIAWQPRAACNIKAARPRARAFIFHTALGAMLYLLRTYQFVLHMHVHKVHMYGTCDRNFHHRTIKFSATITFLPTLQCSSENNI